MSGDAGTIAQVTAALVERIAHCAHTAIFHSLQSQLDYVPSVRKPKTQNRAPLMCLPSQPALKVRLVASTKLNGNEWAWVVNARARSRVALRSYIINASNSLHLIKANRKVLTPGTSSATARHTAAQTTR